MVRTPHTIRTSHGMWSACCVFAHSRSIMLIALMLIGAAVTVKGAYDLAA